MLASREPVFILGICPRSGTNYLHQLLSMHPDCVESKHYGEGFIIYRMDELQKYINKVKGKWVKEWNNDPKDFVLNIQEGIYNYLSPENAECKYVITKTPNPKNAHLFLQMFTRGKIIFIIRNGQDLAESFMKTFNSRFDDAVRGWANGAKSICRVIHDKSLMDSGRVITIKYEDLYNDNETVMTELFQFLKLDPSKYDFEKSRNFNVIGSSTFKGESEKITWEPVKKNKEFNPVNKFKDWSIFRHYRFNWIAGKYSLLLGYKIYHSNKNFIYFLTNCILMLNDFTFRTSRRIFLKVTGRYK